MEKKYIEFKGKKIEINPELDLIDESQSSVIQEKVRKANEMLRTVGLPKFKLVVAA